MAERAVVSAMSAHLVHQNSLVLQKKMVSSIRTPMVIQGRLERAEINLMHFKWEMT